MKLIETIKVTNGNYLHLDYHQWRIDWSRKKLFFQKKLKLELPPPPKKGDFRCRVIYSENIEKIEFIPQKKRVFKKFSLVFSNIEYSLKYENRDSIENIKKKFLQNSDEIILIKDNLVTDTSIANIAIFSNNRWITPEKPLLQGTTRERLLRKGDIFKAKIEVSQILESQKIALMNSMLGFHIINNPIIRNGEN